MKAVQGIGRGAFALCCLSLALGCQHYGRAPKAASAVTAPQAATPHSNANVEAAQKVLGLASRGDLEGLQRTAKLSTAPNERLFSGYLLDHMDSVRFRTLFCNAFPSSERDAQAFVDLASDLPCDPKSEVNQVSRPDVKWPIEFWAIEKAMLACVKEGEPTAVHRFMLLDGKGDGEISEGLTSDFMELFIDHPDLIVGHWADFKNHLSFLDDLEGWREAPEAQKARETYKALLSPSDPRLPLILKHFEQTH